MKTKILTKPMETRPQKEKDFEVMLEGPGHNLAIINKGYEIITTTSNWQSLWEKMFTNSDFPQTKPEVDFGKDVVIAIFLGQKLTGGYQIYVSSIEDQEDKKIVMVKEISPGKECRLTQGITSPFQIIKLPKQDKEIKFVTLASSSNCLE